jgi:hypothetical protein
MSIFGNRRTSEIIASIFQRADELTRNEIVNQEINFQNERDRVSVLCREIRRKINNNPFIRTLSISAEPIDNTQGDALFIFRYIDEIKVGLVEAKLLRINNVKNLNNKWDWHQGNTQNSHFTNQIQNHQKWNSEMAIWCMFIPNCQNGTHSPPLMNRGSSNIWSSEMINHQRVSTPQTLWSYTDILTPPNGYNYQNLYSIIKSILNCNKGVVINRNGRNKITVQSTENDSMEIPIPFYKYGSIKKDFRKFVNKYRNIVSYNYYQFDDLFEIVKNYKTNRYLPSEEFKDEEEYTIFKKLLDENIE